MRLHPKYAVLGNGRWAGVIHGILAQQQCEVVIIQQTRRGDRESNDEYRARIGSSLAKSGATVAWICIPPSPNTLLLSEAAVESGLHVIAEKPWLWTQPASQALNALAHARGRLIGVHFEYCLLEAVESWRRQQNRGVGLKFSGRFTTSRRDRLGIPAIENLGSHLFAIRAYAVPEAAISEIDCGFEDADERLVSIGNGNCILSTIDFTANREPIIQRFIEQFEGALNGGPFPFGLDFAELVLKDLSAFREKN